MSDKNSMPNNFEQMQKELEFYKEYGLYDESFETGNCGVGVVASVKAERSRKVVEMGLEALRALAHRGAVDADGKTGDGCGVMMQIPQGFFRTQAELGGRKPEGKLAVGVVFLPRLDQAAQDECKTIIEEEILKVGYPLFGWRQVPINEEICGEKAATTRPEIEQIMIGGLPNESEAEFERNLFLIRRKIEKRALAVAINDLYIASLSCRHIIYKGMVLVTALTDFYPDLMEESFISSFLIFHQRYSTNTFPKWSLAQPFRTLAHNGEINTLRGNIQWMKVHERVMTSKSFKIHGEDIRPIIQPGSSDSAALDAAFEIIVRAGRSAPLAKSMLIPEAWSNSNELNSEERAFYQYLDALMKPWDGPAAIVACDGTNLVAGIDRNGLRPLRYALTKDDILFVGSETGMVRLEADEVLEKGKIGPGDLISVDFEEKKFYRNEATKQKLVSARPYLNLTQNIKTFEEVLAVDKKAFDIKSTDYDKELLFNKQLETGYTREDIEMLLKPMAKTGKEAIGSMGDDTPPAVLSNQYRGFHHFFRQNFSQVTNPPIDPIREAKGMNLTTRFGNLVNVLDEACLQNEVIVLQSPLLLGAEDQALNHYMSKTTNFIETCFEVTGEHSLRDAIERIQERAQVAVKGGITHLVLSDIKKREENHLKIPMVLAIAAVHTHLITTGLRSRCSLNVVTNECMDPHSYSVMISSGATTVYPILAEATLEDLYEKGHFKGINLGKVKQNFRSAMNQGLLKIMSKMGISVVSSFRGGFNFEAFGLSRSLVAKYFPGVPSRISGMGFIGLQKRLWNVANQHKISGNVLLPVGGVFSQKQTGERHALSGNFIHQLQSSLHRNSFSQFKKATSLLLKNAPIHLRDLLDFKPLFEPIGFEEVESITSIRKRFLTPGMSLGALSPEAHGTLNIAMNRIGARSVSGEGGEDSNRYIRQPDGDSANSAVKQVASGRFGVTAQYLNQCEEIEIKVAQGAKPGEGGQLPGFKVTAEIARLRHSVEGVTLISPPPHHDIYSIEDLAQLIYDLKQINPRAKVCVKLVARSGIGAIAVGVAKANADVILISGHNGGTGASPRSSIMHAGLPWEMGLSEAHQLLSLNRLRDRVVLRVDGGIRSGRDIVIAALLGAEEFGIGTAALVAMGCLLVRQCQSNVCPVGICTQRPELRQKFEGTPEKVIRLFTFLAEEVREILAELGVKDFDSIVGQSRMLKQIYRGHDYHDDIDLTPLLVSYDSGKARKKTSEKIRNAVDQSLDEQIFMDAAPFFVDGKKMELTYNIENTHRSVGSRLSSLILKTHKEEKLAVDHFTLRLRGSAGQSLGAFSVRGLKLIVSGDANDYVGKGLSGATIVITPFSSSVLQTNKNSLIGNTVLYGATSGYLFAAGQAGERFAVRNSGANTVVEGCGANGCEYMTGGKVLVLGDVGDNFAAGMTGGMAFVLDETGNFENRINSESVIFQRIESEFWEAELLKLLEMHIKETESAFANEIYEHWNDWKSKFWQICPKEMLDRIEQPIKTPKKVVGQTYLHREAAASSTENLGLL